MIKIGMIGMSEGNAHPYSWSAIINGTFDGAEITSMGYPAVSAYLEANRDTLGVPAACITHIWCQQRSISESIARSSNIHHIVEKPEDMIDGVDAIIIGRDDPENHVSMARPFIDAGIPVFVDKPLAYCMEDLDWFAAQQRKGKFIMSCSSMRYANECRVIKQDLAGLGHIELVTAVGKKDWKKYGIHLLEAVSAVLSDPRPLSVQYIGELKKEIVHLRLQGGTDVMLHLFSDITGTFQVSFFGNSSWILADIKNSYSMFRDNIIEFVRSVQENKPRLDFEITYQLVKVLIAAEESRKQGGIKISF